MQRPTLEEAPYANPAYGAPAPFRLFRYLDEQAWRYNTRAAKRRVSARKSIVDARTENSKRCDHSDAEEFSVGQHAISEAKRTRRRSPSSELGIYGPYGPSHNGRLGRMVQQKREAS